MEGLDIVQFIRKNKPDTKVIVLTGCGNLGIRDQAYRMGVTLYLEKPFSSSLLRNIIKTHLGGK